MSSPHEKRVLTDVVGFWTSLYYVFAVIKKYVPTAQLQAPSKRQSQWRYVNYPGKWEITRPLVCSGLRLPSPVHMMIGCSRRGGATNRNVIIMNFLSTLPKILNPKRYHVRVCGSLSSEGETHKAIRFVILNWGAMGNAQRNSSNSDGTTLSPKFRTREARCNFKVPINISQPTYPTYIFQLTYI